MTAGGQTAVANQVSQINDLIARHVSGMIINPIDGAAVIPALKKAQAAKIPVVVVDSPTAARNESLYETFIATDNVKAGRDLAAYLVANTAGGDVKVAIIEVLPARRPATTARRLPRGAHQQERQARGLRIGGVGERQGPRGNGEHPHRAP